MASISTISASGGSLDATEMRNARRVPAGSGTVLLYARPLPSPDAAARSAAASSAYELFAQMQTVPALPARIDLYA